MKRKAQSIHSRSLYVNDDGRAGGRSVSKKKLWALIKANGVRSPLDRAMKRGIRIQKQGDIYPDENKHRIASNFTVDGRAFIEREEFQVQTNNETPKI